jgi:hypothetical protein
MLQRRALIAAWAGGSRQALADYAASVPGCARRRHVVPLARARGDVRGGAGARRPRGRGGARARERGRAARRARPVVRLALARHAGAVARSGGPARRRPRGRARATAARLLGAAAALRARCGAEVIGPDRARYEATVAAARAAARAPSSPAHWEAGAALDLDGAFGSPPRPTCRRRRSAAPARARAARRARRRRARPVVPPRARSTARAAPPAGDAEAGGRRGAGLRPAAVTRDGVPVPPAPS